MLDTVYMTVKVYIIYIYKKKKQLNFEYFISFLLYQKTCSVTDKKKQDFYNRVFY